MAILFDLDGTLLDTVSDFVVVTNKLLQEQNLSYTVTEKEIRPLISFGSKRIISDIFKLDNKNEKFNSLWEAFLKHYQELNFAYTKPFAGILELLDNLEKHKIPWGIVTNKLGYLTNQLLKVQNLFHRASCIVCGDTTSKPKPAPDPLLHASKLLNILPKDCIYIGDAKHDIIAGNAAGMYTISALYGYIGDFNDALLWPVNNNVKKVQEIFPLVYQWHTKKTLIN